MASSRRLWVIVVALAIVWASLIVLQTPSTASTPPTIGLPSTVPDYMRYISVNNFRFDPLRETPSIPDSLRYGNVPRNIPMYYIVQFKGPVTPAMKAGLEATGAVLLHYVPYNAFIVRADGNTIERAQSLPSVRWAGIFEPAYKLSPRLSDAYGEILARAMERARNGDNLPGAAVTVIGDGVPTKSVRVDAAGAGTASFSPSIDPRRTAGAVGPVTSAGAGPASAASQGSTIALEIVAFERSRVPEIVRAVSLLGGKQIAYSWGQSGGVRVELDKGALALVARVPGVMYIDRFAQPYVFNDIARWVVQSGDTENYATPVHDHGIHGTGQTITLGDTGIDYKHPAFWDPNNETPGPNARKLTAYYKGCSDNCDLTDNGINHGTHTSGSAAGDDGVWHVYDGDPFGSNGTTGPHDGQAFDAWLNMQDLSNDGFFIYFDSITALWQGAVDHDSWIHSNSWGSCCGTYIQEAADTDAFIWKNQDFLVVFAAGNAGPGLNSMNPFGVAKNVIAAGATVNGLGLENIADFSSRGPAEDGRLKPDIMAPGVSLWSAQGLDPGGDGTAYWQLSGTSMATPTIAGSAVLVRQYYMDGWYPTGTKSSGDGFTPSAALIKATMINSAREMTGSGAYGNGETWYPNDNQGWGRLTLDDALYFQGDARGLVVDDNRAGLQTGDVVNYTIAVGDPSLPVEITLVWSDYPGMAGCNPCLVNDLDLTVVAPDGTVYRGNQYMGYNPGESQPNPSNADHLNNVEGVLVISNVQVGAWKVSVSGYDIPQGPQAYAIVVTGGLATERGTVRMDHDSYRSDATVNVRVVDTGLNLDPNAPDTAQVNMSSTTETTPEVVILTETGNDSSVFAGSIPLESNATPTPGDGILQVQNGDTITAEYFDSNDGSGGSGPVYDYAVVDDTPPRISDVGVTNLRFNRATITWTTDEPSDSLVGWDTVTPPANTTSDARRVTAHAVQLRDLAENTTYYFYVQSTDEAGNTATDNNNGSYYQFTTPPKPPTAPPDVEWPTFHNNLPRQGFSPSNFQPPISQVWSDGPYLLQLWNGPVMKDGMVFSAPLDGTLRARDAFTGDILWDRRLGDQYYYTGTMAIANGVVYATFYGNAGGFVYALDEFTGETLWVVGQKETNLDFNARIEMTYADGLVLGTTWGAQAYALNATDGSVLWTAQLDSFTIAGASVNAGVAYFSTVAGSVYALDEFTGSVLWSRGLGDTVTTTPLYAEGKVFAGTYSGDMFALDALSGDVVWQTGGFGLIDVSTPAYDGLAIYFGDFNSEYVALDASSGSVIWRRSVAGPVGTAPALANGFLYATCWYCPLYTIDTIDGSIVDQDAISPVGSTIFPAISDGWVWLEDYEGNIYGFFGQLPVGLIVSPSRAHQDTTPDSTVDYTLTVKNIGISGPDTFDATVTLGEHQWAVDLFEADGTTPLPDTDGDGVPDTGSLATGESATVIARVTVPADAGSGDKEVSTVTFTSSNDPTRSKSSVLTTLVPPPGVAVGPRSYFAPKPGDTVTATMSVKNTGGLPDTIDMTATSDLGWAVRLYQADGTTPLEDTDGDGVPDVGLVPGLQSVSIVIQVDVPGDAPEDTVQRTAVKGTSSLDPNASGTGLVVIEITAPPSEVWPTFHNNNKRHGMSPSPHTPPLKQLWSSSPNLLHLWTGPVEADGILFSTTLDGYIRARDPWSGTVYWEKALGDTYFYTGTPVVANGVVYATFYGFSGGHVYALNENDGSILWSVGRGETGLDFNARVAMAYHDGLVIGAAWGNFVNGQVYALDAATGSLVWRVDATGLPFGGAAVGLGTVFYGTTAGQVLAIDEKSGALLWSVTLDNTVTSPPLIAQGNLFVGTYAGSMYALDASSGATLWRTGGFGLIDFSTPAYDGNALYFGDFNGEYVALDVGTGNVLWRTSIGGPVGSSVAYANGYVYGTAWDGYLRVLEAATGKIVDQEKLSSFASTSMPAISRGWVWVEDYDGRIYGFGGPGAGELREVVVSPSSADVVVGAAAIFKASGLDAFGNPIRVSNVEWSSAAGLGTVLTISGDTAIYIAGVTTGTDTLQAETQGLTGTATVHILPGGLDHVDVMPGVASVVAGGTQQFTAEAKDRFGNSIPGLAATWSITGSIGMIDANGLFTASTKVGKGTVVATIGGKVGVAQVEIVPGAIASLRATPARVTIAVGTTTLIQAQGLDQYDNPIPGLTYSWASTIGSITPAGADGATAVLSAGFQAGTGTVSVAAQGKTLTIDVVVTPGPLNRILLSPSPATVEAGKTLQFAATPMDMFGNAISGLTLTWSVTGGIGTISPTGVLTAATTVGSGSVLVTAGTITESVSVRVVPGKLASIAVSAGSVPAGSTIVLSATGKDQYGNDVDAAIAWSSDAGMVLPLNSRGTLAQFVAPTTSGLATIRATSGDVTKELAVNVVPGPVAYVLVSPSIVDRLRPGDSAKFAATATDIYGNAIPGATVVWTASAGTIASDGTFTAPRGSGIVVITATVGGRQGQALVFVGEPARALTAAEQVAQPASIVSLGVAVLLAIGLVAALVRNRRLRGQLGEERRRRGG